jgi:hypothetical protein
MRVGARLLLREGKEERGESERASSGSTLHLYHVAELHHRERISRRESARKNIMLGNFYFTTEYKKFYAN